MYSHACMQRKYSYKSHMFTVLYVRLNEQNFLNVKKSSLPLSLLLAYNFHRVSSWHCFRLGFRFVCEDETIESRVHHKMPTNTLLLLLFFFKKSVSKCGKCTHFANLLFELGCITIQELNVLKKRYSSIGTFRGQYLKKFTVEQKVTIKTERKKTFVGWSINIQHQVSKLRTALHYSVWLYIHFDGKALFILSVRHTLFECMHTY